MQYMKTKTFSLKARVKSFRYAFDGLENFFTQEHNVWIHAAATIACVLLALVTGVSRTEIIFLVMAGAFVWSAELFNTAIERMTDMISREKTAEAKKIKDMAAAAVLVAAIAALCTGSIIFIPKIF
jgi:diacylglycerol kinase (ATP)